MRQIVKTSLSRSCLFFVTLSLGLAAPLAAQESEDADPSSRAPVFEGWTGAATLGANTSTGSSETSSVNGSLRVGKRSGAWENWFFASAFKGESAVAAPRRDAEGNIVLDDNNEEILDIVRGDTSDRITAGWQPRYYFSEKTYGFGKFDWLKDEPAGIRSSNRQMIGVGHSFYRDQTGHFSIELGAGRKSLKDVTDETVDGEVGYIAANYLYRVNPNVTFNADASSDFGGDSRATEAAVGIAFKLTETLAFGISHYVRANGDVTNERNPLSARRDSVTTMNLVIDI